MENKQLKMCSDSHDQVFYSGKDCPVCIVHRQMDELLDEKEDIDQENINELFKRVDKLERIVLPKKRFKLFEVLHRQVWQPDDL